MIEMRTKMSKQNDPRTTKKRSKQKQSGKGARKTMKKKEKKMKRERALEKRKRDHYAQQRGIFLQKQRENKRNQAEKNKKAK